MNFRPISLIPRSIVRIPESKGAEFCTTSRNLATGFVSVLHQLPFGTVAAAVHSSACLHLNASCRQPITRHVTVNCVNVVDDDVSVMSEVIHGIHEQCERAIPAIAESRFRRERLGGTHQATAEQRVDVSARQRLVRELNDVELVAGNPTSLPRR